MRNAVFALLFLSASAFARIGESYSLTEARIGKAKDVIPNSGSTTYIHEVDGHAVDIVVMRGVIVKEIYHGVSSVEAEAVMKDASRFAFEPGQHQGDDWYNFAGDRARYSPETKTLQIDSTAQRVRLMRDADKEKAEELASKAKEKAWLEQVAAGKFQGKYVRSLSSSLPAQVLLFEKRGKWTFFVGGERKDSGFYSADPGGTSPNIVLVSGATFATAFVFRVQHGTDGFHIKLMPNSSSGTPAFERSLEVNSEALQQKLQQLFAAR
jgi:hypothetical protein